MKFTIRAATEKDYDKIISLLLDIALLHSRGRPDLFEGGYSKYTREELEKVTADPETPVFIAADEDDNAAGYIFCRLKINPAHGPLREYKSLYVDDLCVDEKCRGMGIGTALLGYAADFAREKGCMCMDLNVWEFNKNAIDFYERFGMKTRKRTMELVL